jgi:hypothetical protein
MILYVNGCSHTAAAEAVVPFCFAEDDGDLDNNWLLGRVPHPVNLEASWCTHVSGALKSHMICEAESASSNDRIIRVTREFLSQNFSRDLFVIIQWSTWEREEWFHHNQWWQVNASGQDSVPKDLQQRYREYIANIDYTAKTHQAHEKIWHLHQQLEARNIPHLFYNSWSTFSDILPHSRHDWGNSYMYPYDREASYAAVLKRNNFAHTKGYHFDAAGHRFWAQHVLEYINTNNLV